ncbi:MAG: winged helix-turn-helix domain-containing protein [Chloroflexota bacterium]|nr:winged helix-turn-helix domain-containing protein [Chloroflexota bacterium]
MLPERQRIAAGLLQELHELGEAEPRILYKRVARYFPQLTNQDLTARTKDGRSLWRRRVQEAKALLVARGEVETRGRRWAITEKGRQRAQAEEMPVQLVLDALQHEEGPILTHEEVQRMLVEVGRLLGKYAETEAQRYDVTWRESPHSPRYSHVFEVLVHGRLDSALAKLKQAHDAQRTRPILVVADPRGAWRVQEALAPYLNGPFHELAGVAQVLTGEEVVRLYRALTAVGDVLKRLLDE